MLNRPMSLVLLPLRTRTLLLVASDVDAFIDLKFCVNNIILTASLPETQHFFV